VNNNNKVYYTTNFGTNWLQLGPTLPYMVGRISVGKFSSPFAPVYAISFANGTDLIRIYDQPTNTWQLRSSGLPNAYFRSIGQHPLNNNMAYAYSYYDLYPGNKIFKTTNRGQNWTNVSGDFPNISITGVVPHPTNNNVLFAGTDKGMWKTTNAGVNWFRWTNGMPSYANVSALAFIDSSSANGRFYVVTSTIGRGIYMREASGDDPTALDPNYSGIPSKFELNQNYPNPFNPATTISYDVPRASNVKISVYDIQGKEVQVLVNENKAAGSYRIHWDGTKYSSGVYFYRIEAGDFTDTKKMMMIK
jgi:hypothetical protein